MERLNRTDRKLLDILQRDGRLTNLEIAGRVNLSPSACLRRIRALEAAGVIRRYVALLDAKRVGLGLMGLLFIQAVQFADIPVMAAYLCLIGFIFVVINLVVDLLYYAVDPRLRIERTVAAH